MKQFYQNTYYLYVDGKCVSTETGTKYFSQIPKDEIGKEKLHRENTENSMQDSFYLNEHFSIDYPYFKKSIKGKKWKTTIEKNLVEDEIYIKDFKSEYSLYAIQDIIPYFLSETIKALKENPELIEELKKEVKKCIKNL